MDASGYVIARRQATVSSKVTGRVVEVLVEEGDRVEAGQILARLDDASVRAASAQALAQSRAAASNEILAQVELRNAEMQLRRREELHRAGYLSEQAIDDGRAATAQAQASADVARHQVEASVASVAVNRHNLEDFVVRAPFSGVITVKAAQPGEIVSPVSAGGGFTRTGIGTIVDMSSLEVEVDVNESFINRIQPGMAARIHLNAYPNDGLPARVIAVVPTANRAKATVSVRVGFEKFDARVVPEMGAQVSFLPAAREKSAVASDRSVLVRSDAVTGQKDGTGVVYVMAGDRVERRTVRLAGETPQGRTKVIAGLSVGEELALPAAGQRLKDGVKVRRRLASAKISEQGEDQ